MRERCEELVFAPIRFDHRPLSVLRQATSPVFCRRLSAASSGDVADRGDHHRAAVRQERTQADFDRELPAILSKGVQIQVCTHGTPLCGLEEPGAVIEMRRTKTLGDEDFDWFANQFVAVTDEQLLGPEIREDDRALLIDNHHRVWRRVEHGLGVDHKAQL